MEKDILQKYSDAKARIKYLNKAIEKLNRQIERLLHTRYGMAGDTVSRGRKGKKPLGVVKVYGFPVPEYNKALRQLKQRRNMLRCQEAAMAAIAVQAEEFIKSVGERNIEMCNILSLYYLEGLTWAQVADEMNVLYGRKSYSSESCRKKHDRFMGNL